MAPERRGGEVETHRSRAAGGVRQPPAQAAPKAAWAEYATWLGLAASAADTMTKAEIITWAEANTGG